MIPFWHYQTYSIGGLTLQTWGTFVALGILVALLIASRKAKRAGIEAKHIWDISFWVVLAAFIGARLGHVFFYEWGYFREHLADIPKIWQGGFSSYGGFVGAALAGIVFLNKLPVTGYRLPVTKLQIADILIAGFPLGWTIGRIGCFLIHDHPGTLTHFVLGVRYPDGIRHDLGLYDGLNTLGLAILLLIIGKRLDERPGATVAVVSLWYGTVRFFLDFLRAYDTRYLGLTPAQYGSVVLVSVGAVLLCKIFSPSRREGEYEGVGHV